jgi:hypothetical protein
MAHPTADPADSDWDASTPEGQRKLDRLRTAVEGGRVVWWGRRRFANPEFRDTMPKRHVFLSRKRAAPDGPYRYESTWTALCGYTVTVNDLIENNPPTGTSAPKKSARCINCDNG